MSIDNISSNMNNYFNKVTGDTFLGKVRFKKNTHYGKPTPTTGEEGEIFFEDFDGTFDMDISAPSFIENGLPLSQKYASENQIPYQLSQLTADSLHQTVSAIEKQEWNKSIQIEKVWENASPTSDFVAQDLPFNWNIYNRALITFRRCGAVFLSMGEEQGAIRESSGKIYRRYVEGSSSGLNFKGCFGFSTYAVNKASTRDDLCTPLVIYGIKGVR